MTKGERIFDCNQRVRAFPSRSFECGVEVVRGSHLQGLNFYPQCPTRGLRFLEHERGIRIGRIQSTATRASRGTTSFSNSSRFPPKSGAMRFIPVTLPPGRARLATSPLPNGSPAAVMTIGMVEVACLAASGARVPAAAITSTLRRTRSVASSGSRSSRFSAKRGSKTTFFPSLAGKDRPSRGRTMEELQALAVIEGIEVDTEIEINGQYGAHLPRRSREQSPPEVGAAPQCFSGSPVPKLRSARRMRLGLGRRGRVDNSDRERLIPQNWDRPLN